MLLALLTLSTLLPGPALAGPRVPSKQIDAAGPGQILENDGPRRELLTLDRRLSGMLLQSSLDDPIPVLAWPTAPGRRATVLLARHEIYAPDAKIYRVDGGRLVELPRSRRIFFWGGAEGDEDTRVLAWLDPETQAVEGLSRSAAGNFELRRTGGPADERLLAPAEALEGGVRPTWACGEEVLTADNLEAPGRSVSAPETQAASATAAITTLHTATVAIDTDNEFMLQKFSDNTTNATNYIASLFAAMDVMYERDLLVRLVQGTTFLRVSSSPDPYVQGVPAGNASSAELGEFTNYWASNYSGVPRALAAMLSGKQSSSSSASGIAWVNTLCSTGVGYSFSQVFKINYLSGDAQVVGHEIGHNFGSQHTHCYVAEERCWNLESCYTGPVACPPSGIGSVMSYCHLMPYQYGISCSAGMFFHPATISLLATLIQNVAGNSGQAGKCIFPLSVPAPAITGVTPSFGPIAGGTLATIAGSGFQSGATVTFGGSAGTSVTFVNATTLTARTPAHAAGVVAVAVTNPDAQAGSLAGAFDFQDGSGFYTISPCRVVDTRNANGPLGGPALAANSDRTFTVAGHCGVPSGAKAISVNATVTMSSVAGDVRLYAAGSVLPTPTAIVYSAGQTRANNAMIALSPSGAFTVHCDQTAGSVQFLVDVNGYYQ